MTAFASTAPVIWSWFGGISVAHRHREMGSAVDGVACCGRKIRFAGVPNLMLPKCPLCLAAERREAAAR